MKHLLRTFLAQATPGLLQWLKALRNRLYFYQRFHAFQKEVRNVLFPKDAPLVVKTGPFEGLAYLNTTVWGSITPKWLGSYEAELHSIITEIIARRYEQVIDVGCAEGYYAVGLARISAASVIVAFDTDFISRAQTRRLARLNGVAHWIQVRGECRTATLETLLSKPSVLVCDIEGGEAALLNPLNVPGLMTADILVEVHEPDCGGTGVQNLLEERFASSHSIRKVDATDRSSWLEQHRFHFQPVPADLLEEATNEHRMAGRVWLWMQAHTGLVR
jgi:hypothetical protein